MKRLIKFLFFQFLAIGAFGSHNQGGVITWEYIGGLSYKIRITTLTEYGSVGGNADRCRLTLYINHIDSLVLPRENGAISTLAECAGTQDGIEISANKRLNIYEGVYTFPCEGRFNLSCYDPNRNAGIINIPNSVNIPLYFESEIMVPKNTYTCSRNSVTIIMNQNILSVQGNLNYCPFYVNTSGDSLVYSLIPCQYFNGQDIPGYSLSGFSINSQTGFISTTNDFLGQYNLCVKIKMFRQGEYIGSVNYDHSLQIYNTSSTISFSGFTSNVVPINGIYDIMPSQTFSLSGSSSTFAPNYQSYTSEIDQSVNYLGASTSFSLSIQHAAIFARNEPYRLYIRANTSASTKDTIVKVRIMGPTTNTCSLMGVSTPTCDLPGTIKFKDFFVYPVPSENILYFSNPNYSEPRVYDVLGQRLNNLFIYKNTMNIEILEPAVYFLVVRLSDNKDHCFKFVKR